MSEQTNYEKALVQEPIGTAGYLQYVHPPRNRRNFALLAIADEVRALIDHLKKYPFPIMAPDGTVTYITLSKEANDIARDLYAGAKHRETEKG